MSRSTKSRTSRAIRITAGVVAAIAVGSIPRIASAVSKPDSTTFSMSPIAKQVQCMAADGHTPPQVKVTVVRGQDNDRLELSGKGFKPGLQFDLFTIQNSRLNAVGALDPNFKGFGMSWYQSDLHANEEGRINAHVRTILLDQIFGLVDGGATPVRPTNTFNVGFWFNRPADAALCGFTGTTPFNGDHAAGPLAFVSLPNATTNLGPLCTSPVRAADGTTACNP